VRRRRPRPPGDNGGYRRRRPKPRPQPVAPQEEEEQQQPQQEPEEDRKAHRQPIENWPTKETVPEAEVAPENYPEKYPPVEAFQNQHHQQEEHHQPDHRIIHPQEQEVHHQPDHSIIHPQEQEEQSHDEEQHSNQQVEEIPYQESSEESYDQQPVSEEVNHQQPNEVTSTEPHFSIPPKRKRPEITTPEAVVSTTPSTTSTASPTTASSISNRLRAKLNQTSRPRFSLNNIKDRLRQQNTEQSKDEQQAANTEAPQKSRFRLGSSTTTEAATTERSTFRPSMSRFTRPPFNSRYRSTTEAPAVATTTEYLATRRANPDIYNQNKERRPSLRRRTTEAPMTTTPVMEEEEAEKDDHKEMESTTEEMFEMTTIAPVSSTTPEDFSYARRVTDLTSSATAFNPLSFFSAVPANGKHASQLRFTMATEDPILPIEAFFPAFTSKPTKPHGE
jgi:hypothetical protein